MNLFTPRPFGFTLATLFFLAPAALHAHVAGSLDPDFAPSIAGDYAYLQAIAVQPDGRILVGGSFKRVDGQPHNALSRLSADGILESTATFDPAIAANESVACLVVQADGKILLGSNSGVRRLHPSGSGDTSFAPAFFSGLNCVVVQSDGKILIGGAFTTVNGQPRSRIARLNPDGTLESAATFDPGTGLEGDSATVYSMAVQRNGKIVIGGLFPILDGQFRTCIARLNPDGSVESTATFNPGTGVPGNVHSVAVQADGKILIGGSFNSVDGQPRKSIARLNPDGSLESTATFNPGTGVNTGGPGRKGVVSVAVQTDGKILIAGDFSTVDGQPRSGIARLNSDGTLESSASFNPGDGANTNVYALTVQADGRILLGGSFTSMDGQPRNHIARLRNDPANLTLRVPSSARVCARGMDARRQSAGNRERDF